MFYSACPFYLSRLDAPQRQVSFYVYLGCILLVGGILGSVYTIPLTDHINISGGMLAYGAFMMSAMLFVIIERNIVILRHIIRLLILVDVFNFLLNSLMVATLDHPLATNLNNINSTVFGNSAYIIVVGGLLIFSELSLLVYLFEFIKKATQKVVWASALYLLSFTVVMCLDAILFPYLVFGINPSFSNFLSDNFASKAFLAFSFSMCFGLVLWLNQNRFRQYFDSPPLSWRAMVLSSAKLQKEMQENERKLRTAANIIDSSQEGIVTTDPYFRLLDSNKAFFDMTGIKVSNKVEVYLFDIIKNNQFNMTIIKEHIAAQDFWVQEVYFEKQTTKSPQYALLSITALYDGNNSLVSGYVGTLTNINELKQTQHLLSYNAAHDQLTGLPNRSELRRILNELLSVSGQSNYLSKKVCMLFVVDLDNFKDVNDSYGQAIGDELLLFVTQVLQNLSKNKYTVFRLGADEFALLIPYFQANENARSLINDIKNVIKGPCTLSNGVVLHSNCTIGISETIGNSKSANQLIQQAHSALDSAKHECKGSSLYFNNRMTVKVRKKMDIEGRLRQCLSEDKLEVHYQPKVNIRSGKICGAEALVRWFDDQGSAIPPATFIPIAEETGLIEELGNTVMKKACEEAARWLKNGHTLQVSVNVSPYQLQFGNIIQVVNRALHASGLPAQQLELELTETALMEKENEIQPILLELRNMGLSIAIDDFGTGYSSLAYLKHFPISTLKIDKSFIDGIPDSKNDVELTSTIIAMAKNLGFEVVAEGVENKKQYDMLKQKDCDVYQGFLCSPAVESAAFVQLLHRNF